MKDLRKASLKTVALFAAAILLLVSGVGLTARAAITVESDPYEAAFDLSTTGVALYENGDEVTDGTLALASLNGTGDDADVILPGHTYDEKLTVKNTSNSPEYVRIVVRKYWKDPEGEKDGEADASLIKLDMEKSSNWIKSDSETTPEREVYYYKNVLPSGGETSSVTKGFGVKAEVALGENVIINDPVEQGNKMVTTYEYKYDGYSICLEAEAQAVQTHNAEDAMRSIWGVDVSLSGTSISSISAKNK